MKPFPKYSAYKDSFLFLHMDNISVWFSQRHLRNRRGNPPRRIVALSRRRRWIEREVEIIREKLGTIDAKVCVEHVLAQRT